MDVTTRNLSPNSLKISLSFSNQCLGKGRCDRGTTSSLPRQVRNDACTQKVAPGPLTSLVGSVDGGRRAGGFVGEEAPYRCGETGHKCAERKMARESISPRRSITRRPPVGNRRRRGGRPLLPTQMLRQTKLTSRYCRRSCHRYRCYSSVLRHLLGPRWLAVPRR